MSLEVRLHVFSQNKGLWFSTEVKTSLPLKSKPRKSGSKRCIIGRMMFRLGGGITAASSIIYASNIRKAFLNRFCWITCGETTVHKRFKSKQAATRAGRRPCLGIVHDCSNEFLKLINYACSSYSTRASFSGQVDGFRNPMKNELKTRPCLKPVFETTSNTANFLNLHIVKAAKTRGDKQLYLITHFTK